MYDFDVEEEVKYLDRELSSFLAKGQKSTQDTWNSRQDKGIKVVTIKGKYIGLESERDGYWRHKYNYKDKGGAYITRGN